MVIRYVWRTTYIFKIGIEICNTICTMPHYEKFQKMYTMLENKTFSK